MFRKLLGVLLVLVMIGSVINIIMARKVEPQQYCVGVAGTFVKRTDGTLVGYNYHTFVGVASGNDTYYDPSTWARYIAGGSVSCGQACAGSGSGECFVNAFSSVSNIGNDVKPLDWYGYSTCDFVGSSRKAFIYGTVTASCSTVYGCYIRVYWHAMCYSG